MAKTIRNDGNGDYFIRGYRAAKNLERLWKTRGQVCFCHPLGMDFFNTSTTTPLEAVNELKNRYDASYSTVAGWVENLTAEDSFVALD